MLYMCHIIFHSGLLMLCLHYVSVLMNVVVPGLSFGTFYAARSVCNGSRLGGPKFQKRHGCLGVSSVFF